MNKKPKIHRQVVDMKTKSGGGRRAHPLRGNRVERHLGPGPHGRGVAGRGLRLLPDAAEYLHAGGALEIRLFFLFFSDCEVTANVECSLMFEVL